MLGDHRDIVLFAFSPVPPGTGFPASALIVIPSAERDLQFRLRLRTVVAGSFALAFAPLLPPIRIYQIAERSRVAVLFNHRTVD